MHVFTYSAREKTAAAKMEHVPADSAFKKRQAAMNELKLKLKEKYLTFFIGKKVEVLIEQKKHGKYTGHTPEYLLAEINDHKDHNAGDLTEIVPQGIREDLILF